jgi:hypothetical protein
MEIAPHFTVDIFLSERHKIGINLNVVKKRKAKL